MTPVQKSVIQFIHSTSGSDLEISLTTDLLIENIMDSLLLMELVLLIENRWNVQLQGSDIAPVNFRTVANLSDLIETRRTAAQGLVA